MIGARTGGGGSRAIAAATAAISVELVHALNERLDQVGGLRWRSRNRLACQHLGSVPAGVSEHRHLLPDRDVLEILGSLGEENGEHAVGAQRLGARAERRRDSRSGLTGRKRPSIVAATGSRSPRPRRRATAPTAPWHRGHAARPISTPTAAPSATSSTRMIPISQPIGSTRLKRTKTSTVKPACPTRR